jgi:hypothetical protein
MLARSVTPLAVARRAPSLRRRSGVNGFAI